MEGIRYRRIYHLLNGRDPPHIFFENHLVQGSALNMSKTYLFTDRLKKKKECHKTISLFQSDIVWRLLQPPEDSCLELFSGHSPPRVFAVLIIILFIFICQKTSFVPNPKLELFSINLFQTITLFEQYRNNRQL